MAAKDPWIVDWNDTNTPDNASTANFYVYVVTYNSTTNTVTIGTEAYYGGGLTQQGSVLNFNDPTIVLQDGNNANETVITAATDHSGFLADKQATSTYYYYSNVPLTVGQTVSVAPSSETPIYSSTLLNYTGGNYWDQGAVCLLRGTLVATPDGEVAVESLKIGDMVLTHSSGAMPIAWIGRTSHTLAIGSRSREAAPIHIRAGALGVGLPREDLWVSPRHCMLVDGALIPAERLVNGVTITQPPVSGPVDYFQLELDKHECVLSAGTWSETFLDQGDRPRFHNAHEHDGVVRGSTVPFPMPIVENGTELVRRIEPMHAAASLLGKAGEPFFGYVDAASADRVSGWAFDAENPTLPVILDVMLDGEVIASALACDYRKDIQQCGHGLGMAGYSADLPEGRVRPEDVARLEVVRRADGRALRGVHKQIAIAA